MDLLLRYMVENLPRDTNAIGKKHGWHGIKHIISIHLMTLDQVDTH